MAKIGKYTITVTTEEFAPDVDIPTQPVEREIDTTDHVQPKAKVLNLAGKVTGKDAPKIHQWLVDTQDRGEIVAYVGRMSLKGLISGLRTTRDYKIANGFDFSFSLTQVRVAETSYVKTLPTPIRTQAAKVVNTGTAPKEKKKKETKTKKPKKQNKKKDKKAEAKKAAEAAKKQSKESNKWK